jgi:DNA-binding HxlR family transcriptional regulator
VQLQEWEHAENLMAMVAGKGKLRLMAALRAGPLRYSQLQQRLDHTISETNLNRARRQLMDDGLIRPQHDHHTLPASDGYELTEAGLDLLDFLAISLPAWLDHHLAQIGPPVAHRRGRRAASP